MKISTLTAHFEYDESEIITIRGVTNGKLHSLGTVVMDVQIGNVIFEHKFHLVEDDFDIPTQAILGKDFLKPNKFSINYDEMTISTTVDGFAISTPILTEIAPGRTIVPPNSEIFRIFHIKSDQFPCVVEAQNVDETVRIPTTVVHSENSYIRVANISNTFRTIDTTKLVGKSIDNYDIFKIEKSAKDPIGNSEREQKLENLLKKNIPNHIRNDVLSLCKEFSDIFHLPDDKATVNNFYTQKLNLKDTTPVYVKNYRLPHHQKQEIEAQVHQLLKNELIEMSTSPFNSPLIVVPKKSDTPEKKWRVCVDYKKLNKNLVPDKFPLARIDEIHDSLGRARYFSIMDLQSGYHQIPLDEDSRQYTAFSTDKGFFQWKVLPFGLNIAPSSFTRMMTLAFTGLNPERVLIYMDDLIVIGFSEKQHMSNLKKVFETCQKYNLKLNPNKCLFFRTEVSFLGHKCTSEGLLPDPEKLRAVKEYPRPTDKDAAKRFIAFLNYYRRFIKDFAAYARPISQLTRRKAVFKWTDECEKSFIELKKQLLSPKILKYPDFGKPFKVTVDASTFACGGVLTQNYDGIDHPVTFISKTFKKGEINKPIIEKELLAIHFAVTTFRPYLYGKSFIVNSDHKPLIYLYNLKNPASKLTRIRLELEEYDFEVQYIKGKDNVIADALSRITLDDLKEISSENDSQILVTTRSMTRQNNISSNKSESEATECEIVKVVEELTASFDRKTPRIRTTKLNIDNEKRVVSEIEISAFERHQRIFKIDLANELVTLKALLSKIDEKARNLNKMKLQWPKNDNIFTMCTINEFKEACEKYLKFTQIFLISTPESVTDDDVKLNILRKFHNDPIFGGHCGQKKLFAKIRERYFWKYMTKDIARYVRNCEICQKTKVVQCTKEPMVITPTPQRPFDCIIIDTIGKLKKSINGYEYAVTIVCEMSKYLVTIPTKSKSASEIARAIFEKFFLVYGPVKQIRTDLGTEYCNEILKELCKLMNIDYSPSTAYHHQSLGTVERSHRTFNEYLRAYVDNQKDDWDIYLNYFQFCYNISKHESNGNKYSPFELVFGKKPTLPCDILNGQIDPIYNIDNYVKEFKFRLQNAHNQSVKIIEKMKFRNKLYYDRNINPIDIKIGELVFMNKEPYDKHNKIRTGPYEVLEINHPNVTIKMGNKKYVVHKNRLSLLNISE